MTIQGVQLTKSSIPTDNTATNTSFHADSSPSYPDQSASATQFSVSCTPRELQLNNEALSSPPFSGNPHAGSPTMFSQAYWFQQNLTIFRDGPQGSDEIVVDKPYALIGSSRLCEIVIPDKSVPPKKYYLHSVPEGVFCFDLTADPGNSKWLEHDQPLSMGRYQIKVPNLASAAQQDELPIHLNQKGSVDPPHPELLFSGGGKDLGIRKVGRRLILIGRHSACAFHLSTRSLSSFHCMLYWDNRNLWFIDLHSTTGAKLDGVRKTWGRLEHGSVLRLGRTNITCRFPTELVERISKMDSQQLNQPGIPPITVGQPDRPADAADTIVPDETGTDESKSEQWLQLQTLTAEQAEQLNTYEQRIEELEKSNAEQLVKYQLEFEQQVVRHDSSLNEQEKLLKAMAHEIDENREQASTYHGKINELQQELDSVNEQLVQRQSEIEELSKQESEAAVEREIDRNELVDELTKKLKKLRATIKELEQKDSETKNDAEKQIKAFKRQLKDLKFERRSEQDVANASLQQWEVERTQLEDKLRQASLDSNEKQNEIENLRNKIDHLTAGQEEAELLVSKANSERELEREQLAEQILALEVKNQEVAANSEKDINSLRASFNQLQTELSASREALDLANQKLDDFQRQHQLLIDESGQLQKDSQQTISRLSKEISNLNQSIDRQNLVEQEHEALRQKHDELQKKSQHQDQAREPSPKTTADVADMLKEIRQIQEDNRQSAVVSQLELARNVELLKTQIQSIQQQVDPATSPVPTSGSGTPDPNIVSQSAPATNRDQESKLPATPNTNADAEHENSQQPSNRKLEVFAESDARPWDKLYNAPAESTLSRFFRWLNPFS